MGTTLAVVQSVGIIPCFSEACTEAEEEDNYICVISIFKVFIDLLRKTDQLRFATVF